MVGKLEVDQIGCLADDSQTTIQLLAEVAPVAVVSPERDGQPANRAGISRQSLHQQRNKGGQLGSTTTGRKVAQTQGVAGPVAANSIEVRVPRTADDTDTVTTINQTGHLYRQERLDGQGEPVGYDDDSQRLNGAWGVLHENKASSA